LTHKFQWNKLKKDGTLDNDHVQKKLAEKSMNTIWKFGQFQIEQILRQICETILRPYFQDPKKPPQVEEEKHDLTNTTKAEATQRANAVLLMGKIFKSVGLVHKELGAKDITKSLSEQKESEFTTSIPYTRKVKSDKKGFFDEKEHIVYYIRVEQKDHPTKVVGYTFEKFHELYDKLKKIFPRIFKKLEFQRKMFCQVDPWIIMKLNKEEFHCIIFYKTFFPIQN